MSMSLLLTLSLILCLCDKIELNFDWTPRDQASSVLLEQHLNDLDLNAVRPASVPRVDVDAIPKSDDFLEWLRRRKNSCAIVGNSGVLLASGLGDEIDEHDVVLRFNWAPTNGRFARDVGEKTTVMMLNMNKAMLVVENSSLLLPFRDSLQWLWINAHNRFVPFKERFWSDLLPFLELARQVRPPINVRFLSEQWKAMSERIVNEQSIAKNEVLLESPKASSGMMAIFALYSACDSLDLYGFGATDEQGYGHYWDDRQPEQVETFRFNGNPSHAFSREQRIMNAMNASAFDSPTFRRWMKGALGPPLVRLRAVVASTEPDSKKLANATQQLRSDSIVVVIGGDADRWLGMFATVHSLFRSAVLREIFRYSVWLCVPEHEVCLSKTVIFVLNEK